VLSSDVLDRIQDLGRHIAQLNGTRPAPMQANAPAAEWPSPVTSDGARVRTILARLSDSRASVPDIARTVYEIPYNETLPQNLLDLTRARLQRRFGQEMGLDRRRARRIQEAFHDAGYLYFNSTPEQVAGVVGVSPRYARSIGMWPRPDSEHYGTLLNQIESGLRADFIKKLFVENPELSLREMAEWANQEILIENQDSLEVKGIAPLDSLEVAEILGINPPEYICNEAIDKDRPTAENEDWAMAATIRRKEPELTVPQIAQLLCREVRLVNQALGRMGLPTATETELLARAEQWTQEEDVPVETVLDDEYVAKVERLVVWLKEGMRLVAQGKPLQGEFYEVFYLASQTGNDIGFAAAGLNRLVEEGFLVMGAAGHYNYTGKVP